MIVIAAVDILNGRVVRGIAGDRDSYKPLVSKIVDTNDPSGLMVELRRLFGINDFYIADLDAIIRGEKNKNLYASLVDQGFRIYLDAGARNCEDLKLLLDQNIYRVVAGLETLESTLELTRAVEFFGNRLVFSLDMKNGVPFTNNPAITIKSPITIMLEAINAGLENLFILDLAKVGTGRGTNTDSLVSKARKESERINIFAGGGVGCLQDVVLLKQAGADAVVVSSAIHNGNFGMRELAEISAL